MRALGFAFSFLTRLPLPAAFRPVEADGRAVAAAACWFPLVGAAVGAVSALVYWAAGRVYGPAPSAALAIIAAVVATGGFHLDGLADTADGLGSTAGRERALEVMRDPRVGTMGALAVVSALLLKVLFLADAGAQTAPGALLAAPVLGRWTMVLAMPLFPYARPQQGLGRDFCTHVGGGHALAATGLAACLVGGVAGAGLLVLPASLVAVPAALAAVAGLGVAGLAARRLGGVTGDVFGAINEVAEVVALGTVAAL